MNLSPTLTNRLGLSFQSSSKSLLDVFNSNQPKETDSSEAKFGFAFGRYISHTHIDNMVLP